jgi:hypothetical protein
MVIRLIKNPRFIKNPHWAWLKTAVHGIVFCLTLGYLAYALSQIGWRETLVALPKTPWFYLAFLGLIVVPIFFEWRIYKYLWGKEAKLLRPLLIKRVYNESIADYSGEAYFFLWTRRHLSLSDRAIASAIKDSSLLSGLASNLLTLAAAALVLSSHTLQQLALLGPEATHALKLGLWLCFGLSLGILLFSRMLFALPLRAVLLVFSLHLARHVLTLGVQLAQWMVILPFVAADVWLLFLAARLLIGRLPLANKELLFSALGLSLLGLANGDPALLAAAFVANGALMLLAHIGLFALLHAGSMAQLKKRIRLFGKKNPAL